MGLNPHALKCKLPPSRAHTENSEFFAREGGELLLKHGGSAPCLLRLSIQQKGPGNNPRALSIPD